MPVNRLPRHRGRVPIDTAANPSPERWGVGQSYDRVGIAKERNEVRRCDVSRRPLCLRQLESREAARNAEELSASWCRRCRWLRRRRASSQRFFGCDLESRQPRPWEEPAWSEIPHVAAAPWARIGSRCGRRSHRAVPAGATSKIDATPDLIAKHVGQRRLRGLRRLFRTHVRACTAASGMPGSFALS
jgi:hypothetical protein